MGSEGHQLWLRTLICLENLSKFLFFELVAAGAMLLCLVLFCTLCYMCGRRNVKRNTNLRKRREQEEDMWNDRMEMTISRNPLQYCFKYVQFKVSIQMHLINSKKMFAFIAWARSGDELPKDTFAYLSQETPANVSWTKRASKSSRRADEEHWTTPNGADPFATQGKRMPNRRASGTEDLAAWGGSASVNNFGGAIANDDDVKQKPKFLKSYITPNHERFI